MRQLLVLFLLAATAPTAWAQTGWNYDSAHKAIDSLAQRSYYREAIDASARLHDLATRQRNPGEALRAAVRLVNLQLQIEDDQAVNLAFRRLDSIYARSRFPERQVLASMTATAYLQFFAQNAWRFRQRTQTNRPTPGDPETWDLVTLMQEAYKRMNESLKPAGELQEVPLEDVKALLEGGYGFEVRTADSYSSPYTNLAKRAYAERFGTIPLSNPALQRPTLYDLLAYRALDFYQEAEGYRWSFGGFTAPLAAYVPNQPQLLSSTEAFLALPLLPADTLNRHWQSLTLMQNLLAWRHTRREKEPEAFIEAERMRLSLCRRIYAGAGSADSLWRGQIERLLLQYANTPFEAIFQDDLVADDIRLGNTYAPEKNPQHRWKLKQALERANETTRRFPRTPSGYNCFVRAHNLQQPQLALSLEAAVTPNTPFVAHLQVANTPTLHVKLLKLNDAQRRRYLSEKPEKPTIDYLNSLTPVRQWSQMLPLAPDLQRHSLQLPITGVEAGYWVLVASTSPAFALEGHAVMYKSFLSTTLAYHTTSRNDSLLVRVNHRHTGEPLANVRVEVELGRYGNGQYVYRRVADLLTDADGMAVFDRSQNNPDPMGYAYYRVRVSTASESLGESENLYIDGRQQPPSAETRVLFLTDRAIYRPGQTLHFKAIVYDTDGEGKPRLATDTRRNVLLLDPNQQEVGRLELTTNAYGSMQGTFQIPATGVLTGSWTLTSGDSFGDDNWYEGGSHTVRVEDYKRPKFWVKLPSPDTAYALGQTVRIKGQAMAYSGAGASNATVKVRVVRQVQYPWWGWRYGRAGNLQDQAKEIAHDTLETNTLGEFTVEFVAEPGAAANLKAQPSFTYTVYVDVTDASGETHSAQATTRVGTVALQLGHNLPGLLAKSDSMAFSLTASTLDGKAAQAEGEWKIVPLYAPKHYLKTPYWEAGDTFLLSKSAFHAVLPHDRWSEAETNPERWPEGEPVLQQRFRVDARGTQSLNALRGLPPGRYRLVATSADRLGNPTRLEADFILVDTTLGKPLPDPQALWSYAPATQALPGQTWKLWLGTAAPQGGWALVEVARTRQRLQRTWLRLAGNSLQSLELPVDSADLGNFSVRISMVLHNRTYQVQHHVVVPWAHKNLKLKLETWRNKLEPGSRETWTLSTTNHRDEPLMAELAVAMYDASLNTFAANHWYMNLWPTFWHDAPYWNSNQSFGHRTAAQYSRNWSGTYALADWRHPRLRELGLRLYSPRRGFHEYEYEYDDYGGEGDMEFGEEDGARPLRRSEAMAGAPAEKKAEESAPGVSTASLGAMDSKDADAAGRSASDKADVGPPPSPPSGPGAAAPSLRTNLQETAFFYPQLKTDAEGRVKFSFTMPEALTSWDFLALAHTPDLKAGGLRQTDILTQKKLMITPHLPRFLREGDEIVLTAKLSNLSPDSLAAEAWLELLDPATNQPLTQAFGLSATRSRFALAPGQTLAPAWTLKVPNGVQALLVRVYAQAANQTDGEENLLPVLSNRMLVTESLPLWIRQPGTKTFEFAKLIKPGSSSLTHHRLVLEFTENPAWYALQALPYLMEFPHECAEQTFSRFFANSLARHITQQSPAIRQVFDTWKNLQPEALLSNLEKNPGLKALLLEETPWLLQGRDESARKRRVGLLFDLNHMGQQLETALSRLERLQASSGGWPWFEGLPENDYITRHILAGLAKLELLGATHEGMEDRVAQLVQRGMSYVDRAMRQRYDELLRSARLGHIRLEDDHLGYENLHYLYVRSFRPNHPISKREDEALQYFLDQARRYWANYNLHGRGLLALALHRYDLHAKRSGKEPAEILKSFTQSAIHNPELGMYWKFQGSYMWYESAIDHHALMIEVFRELEPASPHIADLQAWLLNTKRTTDWGNTKSTVEACYALLGKDLKWVEAQPVSISLGGSEVEAGAKEAGTGHWHREWSADQIRPAMGKVRISKTGSGPSWGALHWQYFEDLDKITPANTPVRMNKQLFKQVLGPSGPVLEALDAQTPLVPGDVVKVRLEIVVDRALEYVHLKDMRAAGLEPLNVLSGGRFQDGLWYYESTRDAATHFFIHALPKGTYVFEYPLVVSHAGEYSNGITSLQCMYAPEFSSHSAGWRLRFGSR